LPAPWAGRHQYKGYAQGLWGPGTGCRSAPGVALDVAPSGACTRHAEGGLVDGAACYSGLGLTAPAEQGVRSGSVQVTGMGTAPCLPLPCAPTSMPCSMGAVARCAVHRASRPAWCDASAMPDARLAPTPSSRSPPTSHVSSILTTSRLKCRRRQGSGNLLTRGCPT
jgi:hypothetical protein